MLVTDDHGRERERHKVPYGATLLQLDGMVVKAGTPLATWDPLTRPIISEYGGRVKFENVEEGVTVARQLDDVTGLSTLVVIDAKRRSTASKGVKPVVKLINEAGQEVKIAGTEHPVTIAFQVGALITVKDGQDVAVGEVLARIPQESSKMLDGLSSARASAALSVTKWIRSLCSRAANNCCSCSDTWVCCAAQIGTRG